MLISRRLLVVLSGSCLLGLTAAAQVPPQCGIICSYKALQEPAYSNKTQSELCVDPAFGQVVSSCVQQGCTVIESLSFVNYTRTTCGLPFKDDRHLVRVVTLAVFALATFFFITRMVVKYLRFTKWGADDNWMIATFLLLVPIISLTQFLTHQGLGLDVWALSEDQITQFLKVLLVVQQFYISCIMLVKASILAFFLRIFPDPRFRKVVWLTLFVNLLLGTLCFTLDLVQRQPTWLAWEGWKDKEPRGVILNLNDLGLAHGGANVVLDAWMLVLPFTQLYKLNHPLPKKLGIFAMFSVGIFLTIVGAIRVHNVSTFATSTNVTSDVMETVIWSCIEVCVGVSVACMPHARQLFREATRKLKGPSQPLSSIERTGRHQWRPPRAFEEAALESGTALGSSDQGPGGKSWNMHSAYTTTTCTSERQPSSFASEATTRVGSVGQVLDEVAAAKLKPQGPEEKMNNEW